jgi:hypothetical protein
MKVLQWFREGQDRLPIEIVGSNEKLLITTLAIIANTRRIKIQMTDEENETIDCDVKITLKEFSDKINWLRFKMNYNYVETQRYFKRVHHIEKDQFEELSQRLDESEDSCLE